MGFLVGRRGRSWCVHEVGWELGKLSIFLFWPEDIGLTNHRKEEGFLHKGWSEKQVPTVLPEDPGL